MSRFTSLGAAAAAGAGYACWSYWKLRRRPIVVVGGGVMGLATAERLARTGRRVMLIDANHPIRGSWGVTRASHLRMEDPTMLRMGIFSIKRWIDLQANYLATGSDEDTLFFKKTGGAMAGPADVMERTALAVQHELGEIPEAEAEVLSCADAAQRFPQLALDDTEKLLYMPCGFTMLVPVTIACLTWAASLAGVEQIEDSVVHIDRVLHRLTTEGGEEINYSDLVVTAGPWTNRVLHAAGLTGVPMTVSNEQTVELLTKSGAPSYDWDCFPIYTWSEAGYKGRGKDGGCIYFYTTPHVTHTSSGSAGVKIGFHRQGPLLDNAEFQVTEKGRTMIAQLPHIRKELQSEQQYDLDEFAWERVQEFVKAKMPGLDAEKPAGFMRCLYQMTPDMKMIIGRHPEDPAVVFACGFSGSGFQFAPAVAELLSSLVIGGALDSMTEDMASKYSPGRFCLS